MKKPVEEMEKKELLKAYHLLRRRYNSMVDANDALLVELGKVKDIVKRLDAEIVQKDIKINLDKMMLQELADNQNSQKDSMAEEIRLLKSEIRELEHGNND